MSSSVHTLGLRERDIAELKARYLACSLLVRGCQAAVFDFREKAGSADERVSRSQQRVIEVLETVLESWCETLSVLRSVLNQTSAQTLAGGQWSEANTGVFTNEASSSGWTARAERGADAGG